MARRILLIVMSIAIVYLAVTFLGDFFFSFKNDSSREFVGFLRPALAFFGSFFNEKIENEELAKLRFENELLKARILALEKAPRVQELALRQYLNAQIYSSYPFNNRGLIAINAGAAEGVSVGMAVAAGGDILLGQIIEVKSRYSLAKTIFENGWEVPVKIGEGGADALFVGGREPKLILITKDKEIAAGDPVYAAARDFPYGMKIGEIRDVSDDERNAFKQATLNLPYELQNLVQAAILIK